MTARDVLETNIDPAVPADMAKASIDDFAAEVLHEGAAELVSIADETEARVAAHYGLASGIGPGTAELVREAARTLRSLATERYGRAAAETVADFFRPGHTYSRGQWRFACLAVAAAPWDGEIRATGFLTRNDGTGTVHGMTRDDWEHGGWTEVTEAGEVQ